MDASHVQINKGEDVYTNTTGRDEKACPWVGKLLIQTGELEKAVMAADTRLKK